MYKHIKYVLLKKLVKDPTLAAQIYHMIYHKGLPPQSDSTNQKKNLPLEKTESQVESNQKPKQLQTRKEELEEALEYLKSKKIKTKKDKESISILEATIRNER